MKIIFQNNVPEFSLPLPIWSSIHLADAIGRDGEEFSVFVGLEKKYVEQLKQLSLDESDVDLQKYTGDKERFGLGSFEDWYRKNRTPFALFHKQSDALAALVWFGPSPLFSDENYWQTAAWRSYRPFRGKGIMRNFTQFAMEIYRKSFPDAKFWIALKRDNKGSAQLAVNLDFEVLEEASDDVKVVMVR